MGGKSTKTASSYSRRRTIAARDYFWALHNYLLHYARDAYEEFEGEVSVDLDAVDILTVHQAKGLEWPVVFIPSLAQGRFPSRRAGQAQDWLLPEDVFPREARARYEGGDAEERRLFYVALTRARDAVYLSRFERKTNRFQPSEYFVEVAGVPPPPLNVLPLPGPPAEEAPKEPPTLDVSFSDLAAFEECGHRYRLSNVLGYQTQIAPELGYGRAIHHVLRQLAETVRATGEIPTPTELNHLADEEFYVPFASPQAWQTMRKAAKRLVTTYVESYSSDLHRVWAVERPFALHLDDGVVSGRADVILDKENDRTGSLAIVDYKVAADEARRRRYEEQLRIYSLAGRGEGLNVEAAYLHELKDGTRASVDIGEKPAQDALRDGEYPTHGAATDAIQPEARARPVPPVRVQARLRPRARWRDRLVRGLNATWPNGRRRRNGGVKTADYRHTREKRTNIPPAKIAAEGKVPKVAKVRYRLQPAPPAGSAVRSDRSGGRSPSLIAEAGRRAFTAVEQKLLRMRSAISSHGWSGLVNASSTTAGFSRLTQWPSISTSAFRRRRFSDVLAREDVQRDLFADPQQPYSQAVQFYKHAVDWANRLILGDSLQVMTSLARRERPGRQGADDLYRPTVRHQVLVELSARSGSARCEGTGSGSDARARDGSGISRYLDSRYSLLPGLSPRPADCLRKPSGRQRQRVCSDQRRKSSSRSCVDGRGVWCRELCHRGSRSRRQRLHSETTLERV